jgi:hypothetical protein
MKVNRKELLVIHKSHFFVTFLEEITTPNSRTPKRIRKGDRAMKVKTKVKAGGYIWNN